MHILVHPLTASISVCLHITDRISNVFCLKVNLFNNLIQYKEEGNQVFQVVELNSPFCGKYISNI